MSFCISRKNAKRRTLSRRRRQNPRLQSRRRLKTKSKKRHIRRQTRQQTRRQTRRRRQYKMSGGTNGLDQILTNSVRFTKNNVLNLYNKFKGNNLEYSANPTIRQFH